MVGQGDHDDRGGSGSPYGHHGSLFFSVFLSVGPGE